MIKISVVTVVRNRVSVIAQALESVRNQTWPNIQHIVIDGASTDGTTALLEYHKDSISVLVSEKDSGIYEAINKGLSFATGDVVGLLHSDDFYVNNNVLSKVAKVFEDPSIDACYGDLCYVDQIDTDKIIRYWKSGEFILGSFAKGWIPPHPTFFVRREMYEKYGVFNLNYRIASDVELMMRLLEVHKIRTCYIPDILVRMRIGGMSNRSWSNVLMLNKEILLALKLHHQSFSIAQFLLCKLLSRGKQFFALSPKQK